MKVETSSLTGIRGKLPELSGDFRREFLELGSADTSENYTASQYLLGVGAIVL